jgi:crossover junction endodeoxyribonuclease RusA
VEETSALEPSYSIRLPMPPSANEYWKYTSYGRAYLTAKGKAFRQTVIRLVYMSDRSGLPISGRLRLDIHVYQPNRRERDVDNMLKQPIDALKHARVYRDDSIIDEIAISRTFVDRLSGGMDVLISRAHQP